ncbi:hypothetical protein FHS01_002927 [Longimicrobium terrae]|uniref:Uncharacterized protein n=1 Tax=Longimicrobium terrae TaxID=1639882 RepID=A0A841GZ67_9BACT|nr:hypothetical protein [Longimicrobium terrae]MBB6071095.1 hypothetical protein [Longimicrobium terrae]
MQRGGAIKKMEVTERSLYVQKWAAERAGVRP